MIKISPVPVGYPAQEANAISIKILTFDVNAATCSTYYELFNISEVEVTPADIENNKEAVVSTVIKKLAEGNYTLTETEYDSWGDDNVVVEDAVLRHLQLTRLVE